jgi:hypothetical protein
VESRVRELQERQALTAATMAAAGPAAASDRRIAAEEMAVAVDSAAAGIKAPAEGQPSAAGVSPISTVNRPGRAIVEGRIRVVEIRQVERNSVLACEISDGTGELTALFYGRSHIPGLICGARVRLRGAVGIHDGRRVMINPAYELLFPVV